MCDEGVDLIAQTADSGDLTDRTDTHATGQQHPILPSGLLADTKTAMSVNENKSDNVTIEISNLSKDLSGLSVSSDQEHKHKSEVPRKPTAQSVIAKIQELRQKSHGRTLVSHAPDSAIPGRTTQKRAATDTGTSPTTKHSRGKEPSEQDERVVGESWQSEAHINTVWNLLAGLTDDEAYQEELLGDIMNFDQNSQWEFEKYINGDFLNVAQCVPGSPHSPMISENPSSPSSGYNTSDECFNGSPSSPAFSDSADSNMGSPQATTSLPNSEAAINIEEYHANIKGPNGLGTTPLPYLRYPPTWSSITMKQMDHVQQKHIVDGSMLLRPQQGQANFAPQPPNPVQNGNPAMMPPWPEPAANYGHFTSGHNCGCGVVSCQHRTIAPKLSSSPPRAVPAVPQPIQTPARIPEISEIIDKLPREELVCARRWVASIKKEDLKKSDKDGDLALHIVVAQYDFPKLIALLERCEREKIIHEVINQKNNRTQTLLFLAIVAAPSDDEAADMISILLKYNADPLISTVLTENHYCFPIHIAAQNGNSALPILRRLLTRKTTEQLNVTCDSKQTALHYAALGTSPPSEQLVYELVQQGADLNLKEGKRGLTPLHHLLATGNLGLVDTVLRLVGLEKAKQAMQVAAYDGCTALHIAASLRIDDVEQRRQLLKLLLAYGAKTATKNSQNQRAADLLPKECHELCGILRATPPKHSNFAH